MTAGRRRIPGTLLAAVAGLAHTASFSPTEAWWLQPLALAGLAGLVRTAPTRSAAAWRAWAFGAAGLTAGLWWLWISMHRYGHLPAWLAALAVVALSALLALYGALAVALAWPALRDAARPWRGALAFTAAWLGAELARGQWLTGFPWIASGYAHTSGPLAAWAPWVGVYGITALAALAAWALMAAVAARRVAPAVLVVALAGAGLALPRGFTQPSGTLTVSLLQTAIAQDEKFLAERMDSTLEQVARQIEQARGQLVVTPESALPLPLPMLEPAYWQRLADAAPGPQRALLVGLFLGNEAEGWVNSVAGLGGDAGHDARRFYRYGKRHLLPFGEFIPPGFGWLVEMMRIPIGDQARGDSTAPFIAGGQRLRPLVCYEDLFGEDMAGSVGDGADAANILVNVSNLAWFGERMVLDQHLQFSRMRALEFERPFIRSTNTGATAVVDHLGAVTARLPPGRVGTLEATVQGRTGSTPYAQWLHQFGLWPLWAGVLALAGLAWAGGRRDAGARPPGP